jgi:acetyl esterase/lipase
VATVAAALGTLARDHRQPDLALMVLDSLGLTITDLVRAGADPYDLQPLLTNDKRTRTTRLNSTAARADQILCPSNGADGEEYGSARPTRSASLKPRRPRPAVFPFTGARENFTVTLAGFP